MQHYHVDLLVVHLIVKSTSNRKRLRTDAAEYVAFIPFVVRIISQTNFHGQEGHALLSLFHRFVRKKRIADNRRVSKLHCSNATDVRSFLATCLD